MNLDKAYNPIGNMVSLEGEYSYEHNKRSC